MVRLFEQFIRHNTHLPEPITKDELNHLSVEKQKLEREILNCKKENGEKFSKDQRGEHIGRINEIYDQLKIQIIIHDPEYFEEIKRLHTQLLEQASFDDEQRERIQLVISHPKLDGIISWHGLSLVDGYW